jgi:hypothetical protein
MAAGAPACTAAAITITTKAAPNFARLRIAGIPSYVDD